MYKILYKKSVDKDLRKIDTSQRRIIVKKIQDLALDPRPQGYTKLRGSGDLYRIRHTDYRIIYKIQDNELVVMVVKVGHRRDIYKDS